MKRRELVATAAGVGAAWTLAAQAQTPERTRRVGMLFGAFESDQVSQRRLAAFREGLARLGWIDGRNLRIETAWGGADSNRIQALATELASRAPVVMVGTTTPTVRALQLAARTVPIVFTSVSDPVGDGFVETMAHPGRNTTGFSTYDPPIAGKWLELLRQVAPGVTRIAVIFNPETAPHRLFMPILIQAGALLGVAVSPAHTRSPAEIEAAIVSLARERGGGFIVLPDVFTSANRTPLVMLAARHRLPAIYNLRAFAAEGGLMSYGPDFEDLYRRSASYVDRILKGADAATLPVQAPTAYEFVFNLATAKALDLTVPATLLAGADEVIE